MDFMDHLEDDEPQNEAPIEFNLISLPSLDEMVEHYGNCMKICLDSDRLLRNTTDFWRLAINLEILASKEGANLRTFPVLGKELGRLTNRIITAIEAILEGARNLAEHAIKGAAQVRLCEKYSEALFSGMKGPNSELVINVRETIGANLLHNLAAIEAELSRAYHLMTELDRLSVHIPVVATMMKIESANCPKNISNQLRAFSENLLSMNAKFQENLEDINAPLKTTLALVRNLISSGAIHAKA